MYVLFDFLYCFSFALCSCSLMLPLLCLFHLSFSLHTAQCTHDDEINFQSHSVPLINTLICLWKNREICFSFYVHYKFIEKLLFFCLNVFLYYFSKDLWRVWSYKSESQFSNKKVRPKGSLWPRITGLILFQVSEFVTVRGSEECAEQKL